MSKGKEQRAQRMPVALPGTDDASRHWLRSIRLSGFAIMTLGLLVLVVVVLAPSLKVLIEQQRELAALKAQVAEQQEKVDTLKEQKARWDDPRYIEAQARSRLYYVKPGEYSYLVIDDDKADRAKDGAPISRSIQATQVDWVQAMLSSVVAAGLTEATPEELSGVGGEGAP